MARSISFVVEGDVDTRITITETEEGELRFDVEVLGSGLIGDLRGLFFDLKEPDSGAPLDLSTVTAEGLTDDDRVTDSDFAEAAVDDLGHGATMKGKVAKQLGKFDGGVEFGTAGIGKDDVQQSSFLLSSLAGPLTLDMLDLADFGLRYTSVGDEGGRRNDSLKIAGQSSGVADDDAWSVDENATAAVDLLANDTNGATNTVTAAFDGDGSFTATADGFERQVVVDGRVLGTLTVTAAGVASFAATGADVDALAVGEQADYSFSYTSTASDGTSFATADADLTVIGLNDVPVISIEPGDSAAETLPETDAPLAVSGTLTLTDLDLSDVVGVSLVSVESSGKDDDAATPDNNALLGMMTLAPTAVLDGTETVQAFGWFFDSGATTFDYLADDESITLDFTVRAADDNGASDDQVVSITVDGANDRPVSQDVSGIGIGEDEAGVDGAFVGSDLDTTDVLDFQILGAPTDASGNQYGSVANNGDGTFTFDPGDNFQFLEAGETRDVSFQYVAVDDSGTPTDTSVPGTVTITVSGAFDAPVEASGSLLFETEDQSMFGTGEALVLQPDLPFFGIEDTFNLDATILASQTFSGDALETILGGIEAVADFFADIGCGISEFFGGDCDADVDIPSSITTPRIGTDGHLNVKTGLQPYFFFTSGDVDASVPVDVVFTSPRQVEAGDTFTIDSAYTLDGGASFQTFSPNVNFGMDFVFDLDTRLDLEFGSSTTNLFDFDTAAIDDFEGTLGEPGFNIFDFSAEDDLEASIDLAGLATLDLNFPVIDTTGSLVDEDTLESTGEDDVAVLDIDVDAVIAEIIGAATGVPVTFGESDSLGAAIDIGGTSLNLLSIDYAWDLVAVNLISTLSVIQDFAMSIEELPLFATFEDGSILDGLSLGDDLTVTAPTGFDADLEGDADGLIDFDVDVDMDAVFSNLSTLGFSMDLFTGLLSFTAGITSDFASDLPSFSLFADGENGSLTDDDFLVSNTLELLDDEPLATLFDEEFPIEGWNQDTVASQFDVA